MRRSINHAAGIATLVFTVVISCAASRPPRPAPRSETGRSPQGARSSDHDAQTLPRRPERHQNENFIMPYPNERRSSREPYRPHN